MADHPYHEGSFSETPPFFHIYRVQWNPYRLVAFWLSQMGSFQWYMRWVGPKKFYTLGELKKLEKEGQRIQVPIFGSPQAVYTDGFSANGTYPYTGPLEVGGSLTITGDYLFTTSPTSRVDHRGFAKMDGFNHELVDTGHGVLVFPVDAPGSEYWNFEGEKISVEDYPAIPVLNKGVFIASDDVGSVYAYQRPLELNKRGISKYNNETGERLWRVGGGTGFGTSGVFETVRYDSTQKLIYVYYSSIPEIFNPGIEVYNLSGSKVRTVDFGDDFSLQDITRNGKMLCAGLGLAEGYTATLHCFSPTGTQLWQIPGEDLNEIGSHFWGPITAYGEDYFVVEIQRNLEDPPDTAFLQRHHGYRIYNAHTGSLVVNAPDSMADDINLQDDEGSEGLHDFANITAVSYGQTSGLVRSLYWP